MGRDDHGRAPGSDENGGDVAASSVSSPSTTASSFHSASPWSRTERRSTPATARSRSRPRGGEVAKFSQSRGITTLTLTEKLAQCPSKKAPAAAAKPKTRKLWGDGKGTFRTKGQYRAATIRGTKWLVQDGCGFTRTTVAVGTVNVRDDISKRTIIVRKSKSYTARPRR